MTMTHSRVAFYCANVSFRGVKEWLPVAQALARAGSRSTFAVDYHCSQEWTDECRRQGFQCVDLSERKKDTLYEDTSTPIMGRKTAAGKTPVYWLSEMLQQVIEKLQRIRFHRAWLKEIAPNVLVIYSDTNAECALVAKAAADLGIPVIVHLIPGKTHLAFAGLDQRVASPAYENVYSPKGFFNRLAAGIFPRAVTDYHGRPVFMTRSEEFFAAGLLGVLPAIPASPAGGGAELVCASSQATATCLESEGVDKSKIVVTGSTTYDVTARNLRNRNATRARQARELGCDPGKPWMLVNVPSKYIFPYLFGKDEALARLDTLLGVLEAGWPGEILLSQHPGWTFDIREQAASHRCIVASSLDFSELAASCDLFMTEVMSSTAHQAVGAGMPTVLLDFEESAYEAVLNQEPRRGYFDKTYGIEGVAIVRDALELADYLAELRAAPDTLSRLAGLIGDNAQAWAPMDGECTKRLTERILSIAARNGRGAERAAGSA